MNDKAKEIEGEVVKESTELVEKQETNLVPVAEITPMTMIQTALNKGADMDQIEKLIALKERCDANDAKKAYSKAVASFKKNPPVVIKDLINSQYGSGYSSISNLINTVNKGLSKHGLSIRFDYPASDDPNIIYVTCIMSHSQGHSEQVTVQGPPDDSGKKNALQQRKSTRTYLKIESFEAITGIASQDANIDDDANSVVEYITESQVADLLSLIDEVGANKQDFLKYAKVSALAYIHAVDMEKAITALEAKRGK